MDINPGFLYLKLFYSFEIIKKICSSSYINLRLKLGSILGAVKKSLKIKKENKFEIFIELFLKI
ncbi:hypothetical protein SRED_001819 [Spiroplasma melliferum]|uniref:Spiroplasmavirus-related protein n=1 Tax=Spiroplasma melliferum TaxID=2134 RepID=A0ABX5UBP8_SPIME|nr:hypothetical protein SRED_001819 [Spiroplasma melliferum]